jgi:hypothetical protein
MGVDEGMAVVINGMTTTTVGSIDSVLGGVRHVDKRQLGMKVTEMLLTSPS